ncbi:somatostatin receptor type 2-like isoform X2 [Coccinella septempunctata]|uniref:somatostatin receptor type 2-like isoform X2 n=1 Tax=Coccinella septempunctata TaxID=41139 RepID=UPI001D06416A|nr:somatostatin receptor type 2-like isoform X2 [Coccinella septempunctata]
MNTTAYLNFSTAVPDGYGQPPSLTMIQWIQIFIFAVVCIVGLVGNTLVIYVVVRFSKMQTVTNMYIVNLAIADECFLIGIPFLLVTMINRGWIFGKFACKAYMISTSINQFTSSLLLSIMSGDRYIAVCHPISSTRWRTPTISGTVSVLAWTFSILLMLPIIQHATIFHHTNTVSCVINWDSEVQNESYVNRTLQGESEGPKGGEMFIIYTFFCSFAIPLVMTGVFYCLVVKKLETVGPKNKSKEKKKSHRKVTRLVLTVVAVYVCCWLPYWVMQLTSLAQSNNGNDNFFITLHLLVGCLSYSNSAMNPILYAFLSDNFKKSFLKACTCVAGREINATLHLENSVFPRKNKQGSARFRPTRATSINPNNEEENDVGLLVSKGDASTSAMTMTSRTNIASIEDNNVKCRNGTTSLIVPPTTL